ncbi:hypothetical protein U9M48_023651 [Paspalum notatum var. saurae]|uniref:Uncharacterized protein n=1 Tax=Paspalum notatum var. saurae TaxID=547442 RepID=A0AAQ3TK67_PASNO
MASVTGLVLNQVGIHDPTYLSLVKIAQLAAALPSPTSGKLPRQPEPPPKEHINAITTRGGRSTQDPPHPRAAGKEQGKQVAPEEEDEVDREPPLVKEAPKSAPHEFYDTIVLAFPQRQKKASVDNQFGKFVEVPTYAKYLKDILNNKKPLPLTEVVHLTEESLLYSTNRLKRRRILGTPTYHAQSGPRILIKLSVI